MGRYYVDKLQNLHTPCETGRSNYHTNLAKMSFEYLFDLTASVFIYYFPSTSIDSCVARHAYFTVYRYKCVFYRKKPREVCY